MADKQASISRTPTHQVTTVNSGPTPPAAPPAVPAPAGARPSLDDVIGQQERIFIDRQPESAKLAAQARLAMAGGVTSSWQISRPQPVWLSHGSGSKLYDVD